jgi:Ca2+-binding RTX toxin-like protein
LVSVDFSDNPSEFNENDFPLTVAISANKKITVSGLNNPGSESPSNFVAARFIGDVPTIFPPPGPGVTEGDVTGVEGVINYDQLHQKPPPPPMDTYLAQLSPGGRLYVLSQPDKNGQVVIDLNQDNNKDNVVTIYREDKTGDKKKNIAVNIDGTVLYYDMDTTKRIIIYGEGGNDSFDVKGDIKTPLVIDGGEGNDSITGGHGSDLLIGGPGDDVMDGKESANVLIGGTGADNIKGGGEGDLIIAGTTSYDGNQAQLLAILNEWSTKQKIEVKVDHLRNGSGLNGPVVLTAGTTVFDDAVKDVVDSGGNKDWLFVHLSGANADSLKGAGNDIIDLI